MQEVRSVLHPVQSRLASTDSSLPSVTVPVDRRTLAKRLWRGVAEDGQEFGFQLETPLADGDVVLETAVARYVVLQLPEPVLEIPLPAAPGDAAAFGWAVGNLHFPIEAQPTRLLAPDDTALRQSLARAGISFRACTEVFRPHRFAAAAAPHHHGGATKPEATPEDLEPRYRFIVRPTHG